MQDALLIDIPRGGPGPQQSEWLCDTTTFPGSRYIFACSSRDGVGVGWERGGQIQGKISPFRSKFASRRPDLCALCSRGAVQQLAALCGATAPTILKAGNVISVKLARLYKKLPSVSTTFLVTFKNPVLAPCLPPYQKNIIANFETERDCFFLSFFFFFFSGRLCE